MGVQYTSRDVATFTFDSGLTPNHVTSFKEIVVDCSAFQANSQYCFQFALGNTQAIAFGY